jgi:hypothetical protein
MYISNHGISWLFVSFFSYEIQETIEDSDDPEPANEGYIHMEFTSN